MTQALPEGSVVITPTAMYVEMRATHDIVLTMNGKLDNIIDARKDHETRIRSIERKVWGLSGAAAVIGAASGVIASFIGRH